jgi:hypothetical protein
MQIRVECYAGYKGSQRPVRFRLGESVYQVEEILDQWYGPDDEYFKVRAHDGHFYILRHRPAEDTDFWTLESFSARS